MQLIFISYFSGIEGMVMSEWVEDKLNAVPDIFSKTYLITSIANPKVSRPGVKVLSTPSLSWRDFKWELSESRKLGVRTYAKNLTWVPIAGTIGKCWDLVFSRVSKDSAARWSWAFTALPTLVFLKARHPKSAIFVTGGATGGHLLGLFAHQITGGKLYLEFQDPLVGSEMIRSERNSKWINKLEARFILRSTRIVFVTRAAALAAQERHPQLISKIQDIYPGSRDFKIEFSPEETFEKQEIEFLHLGTLYGSRNLDLFFDAVDQLRVENFPNSERIRIKNLGDIYLGNKRAYLSRDDFELLEPQNRVEALRRAAQSEVLLLVQHSDSRSRETIPYKTYDYLNLKKQVFAISLNQELTELLSTGPNYIAEANSLNSIRTNLEYLLKNYEKMPRVVKSGSGSLELKNQFMRIFQ
jgi:hypothetical protein